MLSIKHNAAKICKRLVLVAAAVAISATPALPSYATANLLQLLQNNIDYYIPGDTCVTPGANGSTTGGGTINPSQAQINNIKTIIGIAKTENLTQKAALIALMTGYQESSGFNNWANDGHAQGGQLLKDLSTSNPNSAGIPPTGGDADSVGIFQQRPSAGWSTFGSAISKDTVWQIMGSVASDQAVAYAAEAFFGTPPNVQLPSLPNPGALKKGLQNKVPNYNDSSVSPGSAAQAVQVSAYPDAYNKWQPQAQKLIDQYWNSSPAVPLPIPFTAGSGPAPSGTTTGSCAGGGDVTAGATANINKMLNKIVEYAWPTYCDGSTQCIGRPSPTTPKPAYAKAVASNTVYNGSCQGVPNGIDCGAFVTHVMIDSGADPTFTKAPAYSPGNSGTTSEMYYMQQNPSKYKHLSSSDKMQPGDIAVNTVHIYIYIGDALQSKGFKDVTASASQCTRAPMAGPDDSHSNYQWFRLIN